MGKPSLKLNKLERTAIHTPTFEEYKEILRIFHCAGWLESYYKIEPSHEYPRFAESGDKMCVEAGGNLINDHDGVIHVSPIDFYTESLGGYKVISPQEFYKTQNITPNQIKGINDYFDRRESGIKTGKKEESKSNHGEQKNESAEIDKKIVTEYSDNGFIDPWDIEILEYKKNDEKLSNQFALMGDGKW